MQYLRILLIHRRDWLGSIRDLKMKYLVAVLAFFVSSFAAADNESLCLNSDFGSAGAGFTVAAGKYARIGGSDSMPIYSVSPESVSGKQDIREIKVSWRKQYAGKNEICFITAGNGSFCGLVKTSGEKIKKFEKCQ